MSDIEEIFAHVITLREELQAIEEMLEEEHPHEMRRLGEIRNEIPAKLAELKTAAREHGQDVSYLGYDVKVQKKTKTEVDVPGLLQRAEERNETTELLHSGLLEYSVNSTQLERLPGDLRAVYGQFIEKVAGTSAVTLPKSFKI